jgi:oligosaccharide repeat unit polymerase
LKKSQLWKIRNASDLPFYCRPVQLFLAEWAIMLATFELRISYTSYPDISVPLLLFGLSCVAFFGGYSTVRSASSLMKKKVSEEDDVYYVNLTLLRRLHIFCVVLCLAIMLMNVKLYGLPPLFGFAGADTLSYQEYGSLRQPLFAAILIVFVSAPLETSVWRRWSLYLFGPIAFLIYSSRGYLLVMLLQALIVFSLRTSLSKLKIYMVSATTLIVAVLTSNFIGNGRNSLGVAALLGYLQIKHQYYDWPAAYLWVISYISSPFSNMCWIVHVHPYQGPSLKFLYSTLPGFLTPAETLSGTDLGTEKIVDGVHTYMAKYFIDFWYFGILGINYLWGLISGYLDSDSRVTRHFMTSAVILGCMGFMFFTDFLTILIILLELVAAGIIQRYVTIPIQSQVEE